jgi:hypothetical protein
MGAHVNTGAAMPGPEPTRRWPALLALPLLLLGGPAAADELSLDLSQARFTLARAAEKFTARGAREGVLEVRLIGGLEDRPRKCGEVLFQLPAAWAARPWGNRATVRAQVRVGPVFLGQGKRNWHQAHRARLFLEDRRGRRQYLPHGAIVDRPTDSDGWLSLSGRPTVDLPMPLGFTDAGFDPDHVTGLGLNVESFNREGEEVAGPVELRDVAVTFGPRVKAALLPADPAVRAGEAARARKMEARWRARFGTKRFVTGVNLAWPSARSPDGETMQLYGRFLDAGERWYNTLWDVGTPAVAEALRADFRGIRTLFGAPALVRVFLFGDLRAGFTFDASGAPLAITDRARENMGKLLALAAEEKIVLVPALLDFTMADGRARSGPSGKWAAGEHLDLITDPAKRARLASLLSDFVRPFAGHPAVLAWEVMNEPENAAAAVTLEHFADLQRLQVAVVNAIHEAGELATVGHRNSEDAARFARGRVASDLGQAHFYPLLDTRPNPVPFASRLTAAFGPLAAGWGEAQARPGKIASQVRDARRSGHRYLLLWSWRGHEDSGDGFAVKPLGPEITGALSAQ